MSERNVDNDRLPKDSPTSPLSNHSSTITFNSRASSIRTNDIDSATSVQFHIPTYSPQNDDMANLPLLYPPPRIFGSTATQRDASFEDQHQHQDLETQRSRAYSMYRTFSITHFPRFSLVNRRDYRRFDILIAVLGVVLIASLVAAFLVRVSWIGRRNDEQWFRPRE